jgi:hypothetical protein
MLRSIGEGRQSVPLGPLVQLPRSAKLSAISVPFAVQNGPVLGARVFAGENSQWRTRRRSRRGPRPHAPLSANRRSIPPVRIIAGVTCAELHDDARGATMVVASGEQGGSGRGAERRGVELRVAQTRVRELVERHRWNWPRRTCCWRRSLHRRSGRGGCWERSRAPRPPSGSRASIPRRCGPSCLEHSGWVRRAAAVDRLGGLAHRFPGRAGGRSLGCLSRARVSCHRRRRSRQAGRVP